VDFHTQRLDWKTMPHRFRRIRRFHFNLPQRVAAALLALFLLQGLWITAHQTPTDQDYHYADCGRRSWEQPLQFAAGTTPCGVISDGILAFRLAGLPLTLDLLAERALDHFRKPEDRVVQADGWLSTWELRHQLPCTLLLLRLPFLAAGCMLGGGLWWVTRRLFGNLGGYTALALYCFSPPVLRACLTPNSELLAALGIYGGIYTCIGVAHAMQGPRRKWRPRILLLMAAFGLAAAAHMVALPLLALLGLAFMLWVAEERRASVLPLVLIAAAGAMVFVFACYSFLPVGFLVYLRSPAVRLWFSLDPATHFFRALSNLGITLASAAALLIYLSARRSRYFGNTTPLLCALLLMPLVATSAYGAAPWLWTLPFLLTFIAGVFADAYESPLGRPALVVAAAIVLLQSLLCLMILSDKPGILR
jgi:hypothetical protein